MGGTEFIWNTKRANKYIYILTSTTFKLNYSHAACDMQFIMLKEYYNIKEIKSI